MTVWQPFAEMLAGMPLGLGFAPEVLDIDQADEADEAEAETISARAIVMGSRGLTGLKSLLPGCVSHGVIQRADRTVIVAPSPEVAGYPQPQP